jgi:ABC-type glycerol-3-phosphate transport system substrate-binding protein
MLMTRLSIKRLTGAALLLMATSLSAAATCDFKNETPFKTLTAGFEAWKSVTSTMAECGNVTSELDQEFQKKYIQALEAKPALYQMVGVANETMVPLVNNGLIRPLDDLVAKYGKQLTPNQLIRVGGKIMAIAMQVNTQHLMYRGDILAQLNIAPPVTYDDVLAAAAKIKASGLVPYAWGGTTRAGWNMALEFTNLYLGYGGTFIGPDAKPLLNGPVGLKTLETLKALSAYQDPEYLTMDSTALQVQFQQGKVAMANLWATRAGAMDNAAESKVVGKIVMAAAPIAMPGGKPATTLWWDGIVIAKNISDAEADAAFRTAMHGLSREMVEKHNNDSVWLIEGYKPSKLAEGVVKSAQGGAPAYPAGSQFGLMHAAIGANVADFFTGKLSAADTLAKIEADYTVRAKTAGFLK